MSMATLEQPAKVDDELKDLDFEIACEVIGCQHAADWWHICLACGAHTPVCETHRREQVLVVESNPDKLALCPSCRAYVRARSWRRLFAFVPAR